MLSKPLLTKKKEDKDIVNRIIGTASEEVENIGDSITTQVAGDVSGDQPSPITEAMQQKTDEQDLEKQNELTKQKKFIKTREELDAELQELKKKRAEQEKAWKEDVERQLKIIDPGEDMQEKQVIPLTSKPKRGQMQGKPGTAKGETGMEVRKSKQ